MRRPNCCRSSWPSIVHCHGLTLRRDRNGNFLSNAAHGNPPARARARPPAPHAVDQRAHHAELVQEPPAAPELIAENQKLSSIVTLPLQLARISAEPAELIEMDLSRAARRVAAEHVPMALKNGRDIEFTEPGHPVRGARFEAAIAVALSNLIRNAVTHGSAGGSVLIKVEAPARLSVIDNGSGLQLGQPELLLEPFKLETPTAEGTGLGLSIVSRGDDHPTTAPFPFARRPGGGTTVELNFPALVYQPSDLPPGKRATARDRRCPDERCPRCLRSRRQTTGRETP